MTPAQEKLQLENQIAIMTVLMGSSNMAGTFAEREQLRVQIARSRERIRTITDAECRIICDDCDFSTGHRCEAHR